ncbi:uncharacterized protein [Halyomorpha halys]|uniref:uncharacterized protein n=1 Tax=Halyomorpha halys TaxID=286706 RepID=UPI0006D519AB|nr:uncharacterized protein LOC106686334 [Halyomorpha halys]XP_014285051.1 uncharacterized protein LOC106686334 [Halyomorpha halys]
MRNTAPRITLKRPWEPAVAVRKYDNICSSEYRTNQCLKGFKQLDKVEDNMFFLLSMEYGKKWLELRDSLADDTKIVKMMDTDFLLRRYVIRGLLLRKKKSEGTKMFRMKRFTNIPPKIKVRTEDEIESTMQKLSKHILKDAEDELEKERASISIRRLVKKRMNK